MVLSIHVRGSTEQKHFIENESDKEPNEISLSYCNMWFDFKQVAITLKWIFKQTVIR